MMSIVPRRRTLRFTRRLTGVTSFCALASATVARAHDFRIIPQVFAFAPNATMVVYGRQGGGQFPSGTAVPVERVVDAQNIGATATTTITDMVIEGTSLGLQLKPTTPGQYLIVVGLAPRVNRQTPAGVLRFLRAEGGVAEAERLERQQTFAGLDSVIFTAASYAATVAQVGSDGPRTYGQTGGLRLAFVPLSDPDHLHGGDTVQVKLVGNGQPLPGHGLEVAAGLDSTAAPNASDTRVTYITDQYGVAHVPLQTAGPVLMRSASASPRVGGAKTEWDVSRTTYMFAFGDRH